MIENIKDGLKWECHWPTDFTFTLVSKLAQISYTIIGEPDLFDFLI